MDATKRWLLDVTAWTIGLLASMVVLAHEAMAGGDLATPRNDPWKAECGSCHVAYPPQLLPAQSWKRVMSRLDKHFGTDASVDPAAAAEIGAYLERYSDSGRRAAPAGDEPRITETAWFRKEHRRQNLSNPADCAACHTGAAEGDYSERTLRVPK